MKRIRLKYFLTDEEKRLIVGTSGIGLFSEFGDLFQDEGYVERMYLLEHSFNKYLSNYVITLFEQITDETQREFLWLSLSNDLYNKFYAKWKRISDSLIDDYNPQDSYKSTKQKTHGLIISDSGTDTSAYNSNTTTNETDSNTVNDSTYAFNSVGEVPSAKSSDVGNTQTTNTRGGQDTFTSQSKKQHSGSDTTVINGHDRVVSKLLTDEIEFRNKFILYDIIFKDIDSILTLQIY